MNLYLDRVCLVISLLNSRKNNQNKDLDLWIVNKDNNQIINKKNRKYPDHNLINNRLHNKHNNLHNNHHLDKIIKELIKEGHLDSRILDFREINKINLKVSSRETEIVKINKKFDDRIKEIAEKEGDINNLKQEVKIQKDTIEDYKSRVRKLERETRENEKIECSSLVYEYFNARKE